MLIVLFFIFMLTSLKFLLNLYMYIANILQNFLDLLCCIAFVGDN